MNLMKIILMMTDKGMGSSEDSSLCYISRMYFSSASSALRVIHND